MRILSLNPGSSSFKFALFDIPEAGEAKAVVRGYVDDWGGPEATLAMGGEGAVVPIPGADLPTSIRRVVDALRDSGPIEVVGCRVVHGGPTFAEAVWVEDGVLAAIRALSPLAPLHNARDVATIETVGQALPGVRIGAAFDTGFHRTLPAVASHYALPRAVTEAHGIRRYGFHGLSYRYVSQRLAGLLGPGAHRSVICHLGSGASVCAVLDGESLDTTMGFTPLEGLVMATRSGDVDPGILTYLMREAGQSSADLDHMLNHESGLFGLTGEKSVQKLESLARQGDEAAEGALELFAYRVAKYVAAFLVPLGGLDVVAFCGGIGEHSAETRSRVCRYLTPLGVHLDENANRDPQGSGERPLSTGTPCVWCVPTDEERQIAEEIAALPRP